MKIFLYLSTKWNIYLIIISKIRFLTSPEVVIDVKPHMPQRNLILIALTTIMSEFYTGYQIS